MGPRRFELRISAMSRRRHNQLDHGPGSLHLWIIVIKPIDKAPGFIFWQANIICMVTVSAKKRLESIEHDVIPSMFVGVLSKDDKWLKKTLENTLPELEKRSLHLAMEAVESKECSSDDPLCSEERIRALFKETRARLEKEHITRESRTRWQHS